MNKTSKVKYNKGKNKKKAVNKRNLAKSTSERKCLKKLLNNTFTYKEN